MNATVNDLRPTIVPKSDQLNSEQLLGGPMIITVTEVSVGSSKEQPVTVYYEGDNGRPYKPCLTMRKVLVFAWGHDATTWTGKSMELFCDQTVKFGGEQVGGIRISRLSDIPSAIKVSLTATKGRKSMHEIGLLKASAELTACLSAITTATNGDGMKKAKALAEKLTADADIAFARAAYAKKVAQLKAAPAKPKPPVIDEDDDPSAGAEDGITADQVEKNIRASTTRDVLDMAREQITGIENEAVQLRLTELADQREAELSA